MNKKITRHEALRWFAVTTTAFLAACQNKFSVTPTASPAVQPTQTSTNIPESTATISPVVQPTQTSTNIPESTATTQPENKNLSTVYMTTAISADGLLNMYQTLGQAAKGKVAVKISSGEPGGHYFLSPDLIAPLVKEVNGTIVECNTAYGGGRADTASHQSVMEAHGFTAIAPVDIMNADGNMSIPIVGGKHLKEDVVGSHFANYDKEG